MELSFTSTLAITIHRTFMWIIREMKRFLKFPQESCLKVKFRQEQRSLFQSGFHSIEMSYWQIGNLHLNLSQPLKSHHFHD